MKTILHFASIFKTMYSEVEEESRRRSIPGPVSPGFISAVLGCTAWTLWQAGRNRLEHNNAFELDLNSWCPGGIWYSQVFHRKTLILGTKLNALHILDQHTQVEVALLHAVLLIYPSYWILFFSDKALFYMSNFAEDIDLIIIVKDQKREKNKFGIHY